MQVDVRLVEGPEGVYYGIGFFMAEVNQLYYFTLTEQGFFEVNYFNGERWEALLQKRGPSIRANAVNRLGVQRQGAKLTFFINNEQVGVLEVETELGQVGVALSLLNAEDEATIEFDNFEIKAPPRIATPTRTPVRTRTPTRTVSPTVTPTLPAAVRSTATAQASWPIVISDTFTTDTQQWPLTIQPGNTQRLQAGEYLWTFRATASTLSSVALPAMPSVSELAVAVDARQVAGSAEAEYGLALVSASGVTYTVRFNEASRVYHLVREAGPAQMELATGETRAFAPGQPTHIDLSLSASRLRVLVNGQVVIDRTMDDFEPSAVGLTLKLARGNDQAIFAFDNFVVRAPTVTP
jgi:hypothetical protein